MGNIPGAFALLLALLLSWTGPVSADGWFGYLPSRVPLEGRPLDVISIDANRDGSPDLIAATVASSMISGHGLEVVTSDRAGGMAVTARIEMTHPVSGLVAGDFNGDGLDDVAAVPGMGVPDAALTLFVGDGKGRFSLRSRTPLSTPRGRSPVQHDFDGDGNLDVAVLGRSGIVDLLLGNGSGRFTRRDLETRFEVSELAVADFDGDGIADLALAGSPRISGPRRLGFGVTRGGRPTPAQLERRVSWLSVWRGVGDGGFVEHAKERIPFGPKSLLVGDFNRDTVPDVAVASVGSHGAWNSTIGVLIGDGGGGFLKLVEYESTARPTSLAAADVDRDGIVDLLGSGFTVGVLRGDGVGGFEAWSEIDILPGRILADDFSRDGAVDIVIAQLRAEALIILKGNGRGGWIVPPAAGHPVGEAVRAATSADFNQDGAPDVAALVKENGTVRIVILLNREGAFLAPAPVIALGWQPLAIAAGDFNADGAADLALAAPRTRRLAILHGDGAGGFHRGPVIGLHMPDTIAVGDIDGDGQDDLVVTLLADSSTVVVTEDGSGGFSTIARLRDLSRSHPVQIGDLDSDGHLDLLGVAGYERELRLALNDGKGGFLPSRVISLEHYPDAVILAEIDNDGVPDVVVTHSEQDSVRVFHGSRGGPLGESTTLTVRDRPGAMAAGDFDGDGHDDVAVAGRLDRSITFIRGGEKQLVIATAVEAFSIQSLIAASDFDLDGLADLAVIGPGPGDITILGSRTPPAPPSR